MIVGFDKDVWLLRTKRRVIMTVTLPRIPGPCNKRLEHRLPLLKAFNHFVKFGNMLSKAYLAAATLPLRGPRLML